MNGAEVAPLSGAPRAKRLVFMRKAIILLLGVLVLSLVTVVIRGEKSPQEQEVQTTNKYQTQTNSEGQVTVEATPIVLSDKENVKFNVVLNTHSVALEKDLKDTSVLIDDKGNEYKPVSWDGGTGGSPREAGEAGHHLEGNLIFPKLSENAKSVKLTIKGIADIDRNFSWNL